MSDKQLKILILYSTSSVHVGAVAEHLKSFVTYSQHAVYYMPATGYVECNIDLSVFDVIMIHFSIRLNVDATKNSLSPSYYKALQKYSGYKILFIQDEYDTTNIAKKNILQLEINTVYTNVPAESRHIVYPNEQFNQVDFVTTLTGYVPQHLDQFNHKKLAERELWIGYRGRALPFWYGDLGQEKLNIGMKMRKICQEQKIPADIEWDEEKRIYGDAWVHFLANCRATLGTESGSNVFDFDGAISQKIKAELALNPALSYDAVSQQYIGSHEGVVKMNQISPKIFEAISLRTALILYEGDYSGVVSPGKHFIELKKDYSNINEVLRKVADLDYLEKMTQVAYDEIVASGQYSYSRFIAQWDDYLCQKVLSRTKGKIIPIAFACLQSETIPENTPQLKMNIAFLSQEILPTHYSLNVVNTLPDYCRESWLTIMKKQSCRFINYVVYNEKRKSFLANINDMLPGKPFTKLHRLVRQWLKI